MAKKGSGSHCCIKWPLRLSISDLRFVSVIRDRSKITSHNLFTKAPKRLDFLQTESESIFKPTLRTATLQLLMIELILISFLFVAAGMLQSFTLYKIVCLLTIQLLITIYLLNQRFPEYVQNIQKAFSKARYEHSKIKGLDVDAVLKRISDLMEIEKVYEDEEISLVSFSETLGITTHQLSQVLNEKIGRSFPKFVNEYRLQAAKKLLVTERNHSILSIAFTVGFKSKSTFNNSFKLETGITPSEFRKKKPV